MRTEEFPDQIKALYEISRAITSEMYLEDILKLIVAVTAQVLGSKICSIMLLDEKTQTLSIKATQAMSPDYINKPPLKVGEGIAGRVVAERRPIVVKDVRQEKNYKYRDIAQQEGIVSLLSVPMEVKGRVIGVLNTYTSKQHRYTKQEIEILSSIANQAAIAIENTELLVKTKVIQEELETRKKMERAKGILMRQENLTEEQAYEKIRKFSMDSRKSMREISEAIILSEEIKKS
ncbi:MAG: GAF and ANTAR domain-containing protein [Candidatus Omnitrophica bacterium]|nr:GAF and ANTAR domain-containing protein [Candidatus Omnitrophota bacterium]